MEKRAVYLVAVLVFFAACVCNGENRIEDSPLYKYLIVPQAKPFQVTEPVKPVSQEEKLIEKTNIEPNEDLAEDSVTESESDYEPADTAGKRRTSSPLMTADTPFYEAIDILRNSTKRPISILVNWSDLEENAGVNRETPIGIGGIDRASVRQYLRLILHSISVTSQAKIGYVIESGVIHIATVDSLPRRMVTRTYNVPGLLMAPANATPMGGQGYGMSYGGYGGRYSGGYGGRYGGYGGYSSGGYGGPYGRIVTRRNYSPGYMRVPTGVGLGVNGGFFGNVGHTTIPVGYNYGRGVVRSW